MHVSDVMQREVLTIRANDTVPRLDELLSRHRISGVPVVADGKVVGVVSRSDVVRQLEVERSRFEGLSWYLEPFDADERTGEYDAQVSVAVANRLGNLQVNELMTKDVLHIAPDASLAAAARCMVEQRVHRLLVMRDGELLGLVSSLDLLRGLAESEG